jgi:hypothetical protein
MQAITYTRLMDSIEELAEGRGKPESLKHNLTGYYPCRALSQQFSKGIRDSL